VPRLVAAGHELTVVARRAQPQYTDPRVGWPSVHWVTADRVAEEKTGAWAKRMQAIETDCVIDVLAYTPDQNRVMYEAFRGRIRHFIHIGTIWAYGPPARVPYEESDPRRPITEYGRLKVEIEAFLHAKHRAEGFPATVVHPGHICGRKWLPVDPQGSRSGADIYRRLARGEPVCLPDTGQATIHHIHSDDIAQLCELVLLHPNQSLGESFSAVAPYAMSLTGCCHAVAALFGSRANLQFVPHEEFSRHVGEETARVTEEHISHSPCCSIAKGRRLLGYAPRYTTEQIYSETIEYLLESGQLKLDG
jgi:nucleoside-diphosphate-sugar epimerase